MTDISTDALVERLRAKVTPAAPKGQKAHSTCRAPFNHDWVEEESRTRPEGGGWYLAMSCTKCTTSFKQIINADGSLYGGRQYRYPNDYRDSDHWSRSDWRLAYLTKLRKR